MGYNMTNEILFFEPEIKNLIWGTEYWTISAHEYGDVKVKEGKYRGKTLSCLFHEHPELFGKDGSRGTIPGRGKGEFPPNFPLLVKIITAHDDLSIQVHPDDDYAAFHENGSSGKTECWYILDCETDSRLVLGHNAKDRAELNEMVEESRFSELIREVPIRKGDFIQMDPGTIHAIKGGIRLLEIQQSSDITYRLYDYGRLVGGVPRPLHLKQALDVIECPAPPASNFITNAGERSPNQLYELTSCNYYTVWELPVSNEFTFTQNHPFLIVCVISGEGYIGDRHIRSGDHFILPYGYGDVKMNGEMRLVLTTSS